ncbi:MAG: tyrosine-type recombinase/integrase, partial [Candidatus Caldarchaeum sp.]
LLLWYNNSMVHKVDKVGRIPTLTASDQLTQVDETFIELKPRRTRAREAVLSHEEFYRLFQAGKDATDKVILALAIMGLRAGEIAKLTVDWVDLARKTITIPDSVAKKGHGRTVPYGKFTKLAPIIDAYFMLKSEIGMSRYGIWVRVKKMARRAGLTKPVTVHGLRATGATWAASAGLSAQALRELFGWANLETAQFYIEKSAGTAAAELEEKGDKIL